MRGRCWVAVILAAFLVLVIGCGRSSSDGPATTSQEELTEFLEENPEYKGTGSTQESTKSPLELGR